MTIQVDTREKERAIKQILEDFDNMNINYYSSKLFVGDYANIKDLSVVVDRKQNVGEIAGNICGKQHKRFSEELKRAKEAGIKVIILIEDDNIETIEDIKLWSSKHTKIQGSTLYKAMKTMENETEKYNVEFRCCKKSETAKKIIDILGGSK